MVRSTGMFQSCSLRLLWLLPCALFGSGHAIALQTRGTVARTESADGDSAQLVLHDHHDAAHPYNASGSSVSGQEDVNMAEMTREQRWAACRSKVSLRRISPVPPPQRLCLSTQPPEINASVVPSDRRLALFVLDNWYGSAKMRGELMAQAFKTFAGWDGYYVHKAVNHKTNETTFRPALNARNLNVDICVLVKYFSDEGLDLCKALSAKVIYWDILDNNKALQRLLQVPPSTSFIPSDIDILISPDAQFSLAMNSYLAPRTAGFVTGFQRSFPLYHSHTNVEVVSPISRFALPYICRVAIFVSDGSHSPTRDEQLLMQQAVCQSPYVWTFSILTQLQMVDGKHVVNSSLEEYPCQDRPQEMYDACIAADQSTQQQHQEELSRVNSEAENCISDQGKYHQDVHNRMVDVVIVAAESTEPLALHRPPTRVVTWMSYGVPVIYSSGFSYDEIAQEFDYVLPGDWDSELFYMSFPRSTWPPYLARHMEKLSNNVTRIGMREKGLAIAAQFSTQAVAERLQAHFERRLCL